MTDANVAMRRDYFRKLQEEAARADKAEAELQELQAIWDEWVFENISETTLILKLGRVLSRKYSRQVPDQALDGSDLGGGMDHRRRSLS